MLLLARRRHQMNNSAFSSSSLLASGCSMASNAACMLLLWLAIPLMLGTVRHAQAESRCNYVTLVKCFIEILDKWTWTLYELKDNVVTINAEQCQHLRELDKCIQDEGPEPHECSHSEIVAASNTVSDLLMHRKNSGTFLKSYYLLTYACSKDGQELLNEHRPCLSRERIGEMTISAGTYLSEKFLDHPDEEVCTEVNKKLQEYMEAMAGLCEEDAALIMCRSLTGMFKGLHADKLADCEFSCMHKHETTQRDQQQQQHQGGSSGGLDHYDEETSDESEEGELSQGEPEGLAGGASAGGMTSTGLAAMFGMLWTALVLMHGF